MDEETPPLPDLQQFRDIPGLDYPPSPMCHSRRSMKREESKETYKLPHRLIEKKRRDRINECIAQLKDLLPEHLKLTSLGHLEKAVVLELTLKHVKTLTALTEQQHQKIIALQNGDRSLKSPPQSADLEAFHSGFQMCTKEVLRYLSPPESWTSREPRCAQLLGHLHSVCRRFLPGSPLFTPRAQGRCCSPQDGPQQLPPDQRPGGTLKQEPPQPNCVPVIQRTQNWGRGAATHQLPPSGPEQAGEPDTDTDSGYGGEGEGKKTPQGGLRVKREPAGDGEEGEAPEGGKRRRLDNCSGQGDGVVGRPEAALLNPLVALGLGATGGLGGSLLGQAAPAAPFCLPFYFIAPSAAYLQPFLEKALCPAGGAAGPFPFIHPGCPIQGAAAALPSFAVAAPAEKGSSLPGAASRFPREGAPRCSDPSLAFLPPSLLQAGRAKPKGGTEPFPEARSAVRPGEGTD